MAAAPPVLPAPACGGLVERRPKGPAGRGSSLLAIATRLRMVALHSSSFSAAGGKSRSSCVCAKVSASVGGGDSCVDRGALRLLTTLEGALPRPSGCVPFSPALRRACWTPSSRERCTGLFPRRCPGSPAWWRCSSRAPWEERAVGTDVGVLEVAAPPVGGTVTPLEGPAPPAGAQPRLWIWRCAARRLAHERRRSPGSGHQGNAGARGPRLGFCPRPARCSPALAWAVRLTTSRSPCPSSSWEPWR